MKHITRLLGAMTIFLLLIAPVALAQNNEGPPSSVGLQLVVEGLTSPIDMAQPDDGTGRIFIADQVGMIRVVEGGQLLPEPLLDISGQLVDLSDNYDERGLLGLALHPDFASNGRLFVYYSAPLRAEAPSEWNHTSVISEFTLSMDNPNMADPASERVIMMVDQPQMNHDAGDITFGPDGYLYIPLGDGGGADDVGMGHTEGIGNAQDMSKWLGKILRIDINNGDPYAIPEDNPFVDMDNVPDEIWASGFRNPWRLSFDEEYGLLVADVGQNVWEEVNIVTAGGNYGWNMLEGYHCFSTETPDHNPLDCEETGPNGETLQRPVIEYNHQVGITIIGGYVYRGSAMPASLRGTYIFGDWSQGFGSPSGQIFIATPPPDNASDKMWKMQTLTIANSGESMLDQYILSFGRDNNGEIYVLTTNTTGPSGNTGRVWRIVPANNA